MSKQSASLPEVAQATNGRAVGAGEELEEAALFLVIKLAHNFPQPFHSLHESPSRISAPSAQKQPLQHGPFCWEEELDEGSARLLQHPGAPMQLLSEDLSTSDRCSNTESKYPHRQHAADENKHRHSAVCSMHKSPTDISSGVATFL